MTHEMDYHQHIHSHHLLMINQSINQSINWLIPAARQLYIILPNFKDHVKMFYLVLCNTFSVVKFWLGKRGSWTRQNTNLPNRKHHTSWCYCAVTKGLFTWAYPFVCVFINFAKRKLDNIGRGLSPIRTDRAIFRRIKLQRGLQPLTINKSDIGWFIRLVKYLLTNSIQGLSR